jgi:hypothetical protein
MRAVKPLLIALLSLLLFIMLCAGVAGYILVTPERVTPLLLHLGKQYLNAEIQCEAVDITLFSTFPNMGVRLKNGYLITPESDTLLRFPECVISFNPVDYLKRNKIVVHDIHLDHPEIYAAIDSAGKAGWMDLLRTTPGDTTTSTFQMPELNLERLHITGGKIVYSDQQAALRQEIDGLDMTLTGHMNSDSAQLDLQLGVEALSVWRSRQRLADKIPLRLSTVIQQDLVNKCLHIGRARCTLAGIEFDVNGSLQWHSTLLVDLRYSLHAPSIPEALALVPQGLSTIPSKFITSGEIILHGSLNGELGGNSYPVLCTSLKLVNGKLRSARRPSRKGIEKLMLESEARIDLTGKTPSTFRLDKFELQSPSANLSAKGEVNDLLQNPRINANIAGWLDFDRMARMWPLADSTDMGGQIQMDVSGECFLSDIMNLDYGKIKASGTVNIDSVRFNYPSQQISVASPFLRARFGANVKDTTRRGRERDILFRGNITSDSINIHLGTLHCNAGTLAVTFSTSRPADSAAIAPVFSNINAKNLYLKTDSLHLRAHRASGTVLLAAQRKSPSSPEYTLRFTLDTLHARVPDFSGRVNRGLLQVKLTPRTQQAGRQGLPPTPSLGEGGNSADTTTNRSRTRITRSAGASPSIANMRLQSDEARTALRQWDASGKFDLQGAHLRTPYFPARIQINKGALQFSTDSLRLETLDLRLGRSDMRLSGHLHGLRQALLRNGLLKADLSIDASTLNLNQLIRTMAEGSKYATLDRAGKDTVAGNIMDETVEIADTTGSGGSAGGVFVIPRNIDFTLHAKVDRALYSKLELSDINTRILLRNQALHLPEMAFRSNVGDMRLSLSYQAADASGAHLGTTLELHNIQVKQLIETFPMFDTLTPMLRAFEGSVACHITATGDLDSLMNVLLPSAEASCRVSGRDLVLLDDQTFTEIAKMLRFKNRERNLIDSLSVEMMLRSNCLMIFPFRLAIDRYQVAVGGSQYLNLDFDYHITVLKSPIPFKFGLNLKGSPGHMRIRLARALYKDIGDPAKERQLFGVLFNLRSAMEQRIRSEIEAIIHRAPVRRSRAGARLPGGDSIPPIADSLRLFFRSDTSGISPADSLFTE